MLIFCLQVHNNGVVSLNEPPGHFLDEPFPLDNYTLIAPFYGDVDTREAGTVWFTDPVTKNKTMLLKAQEDIHSAFPDSKQFSPTYLIVATWDHVGYYEEQDDKVHKMLNRLCTITKVSIISSVAEYFPMHNCHGWEFIFCNVSLQ